MLQRRWLVRASGGPAVPGFEPGVFGFRLLLCAHGTLVALEVALHPVIQILGPREGGEGPSGPSRPGRKAWADGLRRAGRTVVAVRGWQEGSGVDIDEVEGTGTVVDVTVTATGLKPGLHGVHLHAVGRCEPDFGAAGGAERLRPGSSMSRLP